jgi:hypothetical protein
LRDYIIRGLAFDGIFIVVQQELAITYRSGEVFAVPAGVMH